VSNSCPRPELACMFGCLPQHLKADRFQTTVQTYRLSWKEGSSGPPPPGSGLEPSGRGGPATLPPAARSAQATEFAPSPEQSPTLFLHLVPSGNISAQPPCALSRALPTGAVLTPGRLSPGAALDTHTLPGTA
jgi:hypothetical protein